MKTIFLIVTWICGVQLFAQVIDLRGTWKFHIDDKAQWASPDFDDSKWESIFTPAPWEDEGFNGYDGFAWYRKKFDGRKLDQGESYYLGLGYIDDCDEVYVNGRLVGFSGSMPPKFKTAYNNERKYKVPTDVINYNGDNTIAIRVFDVTHEGGIIDGRIGLYKGERDKHLLLDLQGIWSFAPTKNEARIKNESEWVKLMVPIPWDIQGYPHYDGFAWYKRTFTLPANTPEEELILLLGKIDDFDKVYLNGVLIGSTNDHEAYGRTDSYRQKRAYPIPQVALKRKGLNTLEVLVEDLGNIGGFYDGVVGIATKTNYQRYYK